MSSKNLRSIAIVLSAFILHQTSAIASQITDTPFEAGYKITGFSDAFDATSIDINRWSLEINVNQNGISDRIESQAATSANNFDNRSIDNSSAANPVETHFLISALIPAIISGLVNCVVTWDSCTKNIVKVGKGIVFGISKAWDFIRHPFSRLSPMASSLMLGQPDALAPAALSRQDVARDDIVLGNFPIPFDGSLTATGSELDPIQIGSKLSIFYNGTLNLFGLNKAINPSYLDFLPIVGEIDLEIKEMGSNYVVIDAIESTSGPIGNNWGSFEKTLYGIDQLGIDSNLGVVDGVVSFSPNTVVEPNTISLVVLLLVFLGGLRRKAERRQCY